jgi:hypothetical protein
MTIEAMKQALKALERADKISGYANNQMAIYALRQAIAEGEKQEPVAWMMINPSHLPGNRSLHWEPQQWHITWKAVPLYPAPVHASDISQERVDETAKDKHEFECPRCGHCCQQKEWVGLDNDIPSLGLVTEEFYNGMLCAEDILRKRNT